MPVNGDVRRGIELMARTGFFAKGVIYLILGYLGARAAFTARKVGSTRNVLTGVLEAPFGQLILSILTVGLAWYAVWRFIEAFGDANRKGDEPKGLAVRGIYLASGLIYAALALDAAAILLKWDNDSGQVRSIFGELLSGVFAIAAGLVVAAYGAYQIFKGVRKKRVSSQLNEQQARREAGPWVMTLSRIGIAGRGLVFVLVGYWLLSHPDDAERVSDNGAAGSLELLERLPQGEIVMAAAGLGFFAYGAYQLVHSRYRRIQVP